MFIQTETTPNPATLKFLPGREVNPGKPMGFSKGEGVIASPLAASLLAIEEVQGVFLGKDFITITKTETAGWDVLKPALLTAIMEYFISGKPVFSKGKEEAADNNSIQDSDTDIVKQLKELIETRVRPAVAQDGGDIMFRAFDETSGEVQLELRGSCSGCPSSTATLKQGIENMLKHYVPEVQSVVAI